MFNTNKTCENILTQSWNLTGLLNFSLPITILCEIDELGNEWLTEDLMSKIINIVITKKLFIQDLFCYTPVIISIKKNTYFNFSRGFQIQQRGDYNFFCYDFKGD